MSRQDPIRYRLREDDVARAIGFGASVAGQQLASGKRMIGSEVQE